MNFSGAVNTCRKKPHGPFAMSPIGSKAMKMCTAPRSLKNLCYHRLCIWMYLICFLALLCKILFCVCLFNKELGFVSCIRCSVLLGICARTMTLEPCLASWRAGFWQCSMLTIPLEALPRYSLDIPWYAYSRYAFRLVLEVHVWSCVSVTVMIVGSVQTSEIKCSLNMLMEQNHVQRFQAPSWSWACREECHKSDYEGQQELHCETMRSRVARCKTALLEDFSQLFFFKDLCSALFSMEPRCHGRLTLTVLIPWMTCLLLTLPVLFLTRVCSCFMRHNSS